MLRHIQRMLGAKHAGRTRLERRADQRFPFPYVMQLTAAEHSSSGGEESIVIVGKHLSRQGLAFYHRNPLPYRQTIISIDDMGGQWIKLLMELTWCRFIRHGWYASGGHFLGVVENAPNGHAATSHQPTGDIAQLSDTLLGECTAAIAEITQEHGVPCIPW